MTKQCSFPGCDRVIPHGKFCKGHRPIKGINENHAIRCQLCGLLRSELYRHVIAHHDGVAAYRKQFGHDSLSAAGVLAWRRVMWSERVEDGTAWEPPKKQKTCSKGHRLAGSNLIIKRRGGRRDGELQRDCRKCHNERTLRRWRRTHPAPWKRPRKCEWCGDEYMPYRDWQRFCCVEHQTKALKSKATKQYRPRKCIGCGEKYRPRQINQRFCSECSH